MQSVDILGVNVSAVNPRQAVEQVLAWVKSGWRGYVCVAPVSTLVDCQRVLGYREVINGAGMVTPDGMPVVWLVKFKGCRDVARTYGPDLMRLVCDQGRRQGLKHFLFGATAQTLEILKENLQRQYPDIRIVGAVSPPLMTEAGKADDVLIEGINASGADIVWVGLGSPKQNFWMYHNRPYLKAPVLVGIGAAFDFIAGVKPQAPRWMQKAGLEWLFRLCCEPKRLWKRYLVGNSLFFYYMIKDLMTISPREGKAR